MQTELIADTLLSVTLSSQVQGRIAKNPEQEVKQCRSFVPPPSIALIFTLDQWRTLEFCLGGGGSTNSVEDRERGSEGR